MNVLEYTLLALLILVASFAYLQTKRIKLTAENLALRDRERTKAYTEIALLYLKVLAREIGNELMQRDAKLFSNHLRDLNVEWAQIEREKNLLRATKEQLASKYPMYSDFDVVESSDYIIVGEALEGTSNEELWRRYRDIKLFAATIYDSSEIYADKPISAENKYYIDYVGVIDRSRLLSDLTTAEEVFDALQFNGVDFDDDGKIKTTLYNFHALEHFAEIRIGVHIKKTNQFGIIGKFYGGDDADYKTYYLSNSTFEKDESFLDTFFVDFMSSRKPLNSRQRL